MMKIDLKLFVKLSQYLSEDRHLLEISEDTSGEDLIEKPGDTRKNWLNRYLSTRRNTDSSYQLKPNDRVGLLYLAGGG